MPVLFYGTEKRVNNVHLNSVVSEKSVSFQLVMQGLGTGNGPFPIERPACLG